MLDLEKIKKREKKATPGPWKVLTATYIKPLEIYINGGCVTIATAWKEDDFGNELPMNGNAQFIAHAREDIPALIAEDLQLRRALELATSNSPYRLDVNEGVKVYMAAAKEKP